MEYKRRSAKKAILTALRSVGGVASRDKLHTLIADDASSGFSYNDVFGQVTSRNGNRYAPFNYDFNFGVRELAVIGLIEPLQRGGDLVLTEQGRTEDLTGFPTKAQQAKMTAYWDEKNQLRAQRKQAQVSKPTESIDDSEPEVLADELDDRPEREWRDQLLTQLKQFSPTKFESFARLLISKMGVKIDKERGVVATADHGIDGYGYFESDEFRTARIAIQAKCYTTSAVSEPEIDKFKGVMDGFNAEYGIFITTTHFTDRAKAKAVQGSRTVTLIDGQRIADLVASYQLHVAPVKTYVLDNYYFEKE